MPPLGERVKLVLLPLMSNLLVRALRRTLRVRFVNQDALTRARGTDGRPYILAFWHARLLMMRYAYPGRSIAPMISRHSDGELIARTLGWFGIRGTRGSTTRGGASALREVVRRIRAGEDGAFTPDGPRGPRHVVQPGVIEAARLSGAAILPVTFSFRPAWTLASWDRFVIPKPFGRGLVLYGEPLRVRADTRGEGMESARRDLEGILTDLEQRAERLLDGDAA